MPYRILVVDDDVGIAELVGMELARQSYDVEVCNNGLRALERVIEWRPHLVILDQWMPGLEGRSVCARVRRMNVGARVIMLTAADTVLDRVAGLDAGADDYVCKPFDLLELSARVRAHLREVPLVESPRTEAVKEPGLVIRVLGGFHLQWEGKDLSLLFNRRQPIQLLKLLLARYNRPVPSDVLEEALWPEQDAERARRSLHVVVRRLRSGLRASGPSRVQTCAGGYTFQLQPTDDLDLRRFDELAEHLLSEMARTVEAPPGLLTELIDLYGGDLLSEDVYVEWLEAPRAQVRQTFVSVLQRAASLSRRQGRSADAAPLLRRLVKMEPTNETLTLELAECLLEMGEAGAAESLLSRLREVLRAEIDVEPGPDFERLWRAARAGLRAGKS